MVYDLNASNVHKPPSWAKLDDGLRTSLEWALQRVSPDSPAGHVLSGNYSRETCAIEFDDPVMEGNGRWRWMLFYLVLGSQRIYREHRVLPDGSSYQIGGDHYPGVPITFTTTVVPGPRRMADTATVPATEPATNTTTEPVTNPATEPAAEPAAEPTTDETTAGTTEDPTDVNTAGGNAQDGAAEEPTK